MLRRSTRLSLARVAGLTLVGSLLFAPPTPGAAAPPASRIVELTTTVTVPPLVRPARVWVPVPLQSPVQEVQSLTVHAPGAWTIEREPVHGNRFLYVELPASEAETTLRWTAVVERSEWTRPLAEDTPPAQLAVYTQPLALVPIDAAEIRGRAQMVLARAGNDPAAQARGMFDHVREHMAYDKSGEGWGRGDALYACQVGKGNCTDFHSLFNGMARSAGIPARFTMGMPVPPDSSGAIAGYHCWTAYWLDGKGWVPADISESDKHPDRPVSAYHGRLDADRVAISRGRDVTLAPPQNGPPLNYVWDAYLENDGQPLDGARTERTYRDLTAM